MSALCDALWLLLVLAQGAPAQAEPPLVFGMTPVLGFEASEKRFRPLVEHLGRSLGRRVELRVAESYGSLIEEMLAGRIDMAKFSPLAYVRARRRSASIEPLFSQVANGSTTYSSYLVSIEGREIQPLRQWHSARLCFADPDSASGYLMPAAYLLSRGIQPWRHFSLVEFGGNHRTCLRGLFEGRYDLAATFAGAIRDARNAGLKVGDLVIVAKAGRIPYDTYCVRAELAEALKQRLRQIFLSTSTLTAEGRRVLEPTLGINGWVEADDRLYDELRRTEEKVEAELLPPLGSQSP